MLSEKELIDLPKVELHRHLEGSVRLSTVFEEARRHKVKLPAKSLSELKSHIQVTKPMKDLSEVLNVFWLTQSVFKDMETFKRISFEAVEDAWREGVRVLELRYSPGFCSANHGHSYEDVLEAIKEGVSQAVRLYPMGVGLIGIVSRTLGVAEAEKTAQFVINHKKDFVGFDLADEEIGFDPATFSEVFLAVKKAGVHITIHSGEEGAAENVVRSIEYLGAERIGHGVQIMHSEAVQGIVRDSGVTLELCPSSNVLTRAVQGAKFHPLKQFLNNGLNVTVNTDDPGIMDLTLDGEYKICQEKLGFTREDFLKVNEMALKASFLPEQEIERLRQAYFIPRELDASQAPV